MTLLVWVLAFLGWGGLPAQYPAGASGSVQLVEPLGVPDPEASKVKFWGHQFDGVDDLLSIGTASDLNFASDAPRTISYWLNAQSDTLGQHIGKYAAATPFTGWSIGQMLFTSVGLGPIEFGIRATHPSTDALLVRTTAQFKVTGWRHIAVTYDGSKTVAGVAIYINGIAQSLTTVVNTLSGASTSTAVAVIGNNIAGAYGLTGTFSQFRVYSVVLTPTQVGQDMLSTRPVASCVLWYRTRPGSGQTVTDESGRGNSGTLGTSAGVDASDPVWTASYRTITSSGPQ